MKVYLHVQYIKLQLIIYLSPTRHNRNVCTSFSDFSSLGFFLADPLVFSFFAGLELFLAVLA